MTHCGLGELPFDSGQTIKPTFKYSASQVWKKLILFFFTGGESSSASVFSLGIGKSEENI
jgi:hypothetical protein